MYISTRGMTTDQKLIKPSIMHQSHILDLNNAYPGLQYTEASLTAFFRFLESLTDYPIPAGELSVVFINDEVIAELHEEYLDDPTPTDVITFLGDPTMDFAGEICVSVDHALANATIHGQTLQEELTLYLIHGWLHLTGLDDIEETERLLMRKAEADIMARAKSAGTLPDFSIAN